MLSFANKNKLSKSIDRKERDEEQSQRSEGFVQRQEHISSEEEAEKKRRGNKDKGDRESVYC